MTYEEIMERINEGFIPVCFLYEEEPVEEPVEESQECNEEETS